MQDLGFKIQSVCFAVCALSLASSVLPAQPSQQSWEAILEQVRLGEYHRAAGALQASAGNPSIPEKRAAFLLGYVLFKLERFEAAIPSLEKVALEEPLLADYALFLLAESHRRLGRGQEAIFALTRLLREHSDSLLIERALRQLAQAYGELGDLDRAAAAYRAYLDGFPSSPARPAVSLALAEVLLRAGQLEEAEKLLRRLYLMEPGRKEAQQAKALLSTIPAKPFSLDERFERGIVLYRVGLYSQAIAELSPFALWPLSHAGKARFFIGMSAFQQREYERAASAFATLIGEASPFQAEALYWLGKSLIRLGKPKEALDVLERLRTTFPRSTWADDALYLMGVTHEEQGGVEQALMLYDRFLKEHPHGELADEVLWRKGWIQFKQKAYEKAMRSFEILSRRQGSTLAAQARYWQGKSLERLDKPKEAAGVYQRLLKDAHDDYYALRARENLAQQATRGGGFMEGNRELWTVDHEPEGSTVPPKDWPHLAKARALFELRLGEEAIEEYWELTRVHPEDRGLLAEACALFTRFERFDRALWVAKKILRPLQLQQPRGQPIPGYWTCLFPFGYFELVEEQANSFGLDPYLILAIIREESAFAKDAVSRAGAIGLMQLLPRTADLLRREWKPEGFPSDDLSSPRVSIALGVRYLARLREEFQGDMILALAAYNAGPHHVKRWLAERGYASREEFIEEIPFQETRNYVKRVLGSHDRYRILYSRRSS